MRYKIEHINGFMYAVDKEADLKDGQYWIHPKGVIFPFTDVYYKAFTALKEHGKTGVVVATNDPSLNLPLLPAIEEESFDIRNLADKILDKHFPHYYYTPVYPKNSKSIHDNECERCKYDNRIVPAMEEIYKAASAKEFTEEDIREAFEAGKKYQYWANEEDSPKKEPPFIDAFIQSLRPKPVAVELEMINQQKTINYHKDLWVDDYVLLVDENNFVKVKEWYFQE